MSSAPQSEWRETPETRVYRGATLTAAVQAAVIEHGPKVRVRAARSVRQGVRGVLGRIQVEVLVLPPPDSAGAAAPRKVGNPGGHMQGTSAEGTAVLAVEDTLAALLAAADEREATFTAAGHAEHATASGLGTEDIASFTALVRSRLSQIPELTEEPANGELQSYARGRSGRSGGTPARATPTAFAAADVEDPAAPAAAIPAQRARRAAAFASVTAVGAGALPTLAPGTAGPEKAGPVTVAPAVPAPVPVVAEPAAAAPAPGAAAVPAQDAAAARRPAAKAAATVTAKIPAKPADRAAPKPAPKPSPKPGRRPSRAGSAEDSTAEPPGARPAPRSATRRRASSGPGGAPTAAATAEWSRARLREIGIPEQILTGLPPDDPQDDLAWVAALTTAIAAVVPGPADPGREAAVAHGTGPDGAVLLLRAAVAGVPPGTLTDAGRVVTATAMELALAVRTCVLR